MLDPRDSQPAVSAGPEAPGDQAVDPAVAIDPVAAVDPAAAGAPGADQLGEEVDALPVLASDRAVAPASPIGTAVARLSSPTAQVAAVAASGFVAGAAVVGLVHRRRRRRVLSARGSARRGGSRGGPVGELVQIVGTRSLLVDVHLLGGRD